jgi:hypothetical protein
MVTNLCDSWYIDWSFTKETEYFPSELTYILFMENDDYGRKNIILKSEIPPDDRELIENRIKEEFNL